MVARRIEGLDLFRGLAIGLVLIRHSWPAIFGGGGIVGVVMFFALSGYLITGLLTADIARFGRVRYGRFYLHRATRLLPALFVMLAVYATVSLVWDPIHEGVRHVVWGVLTGVTYTANVPFFKHGVALGHLWTLATEEQFYLVWPVVLAVGIRLGRLRLCAGIAAAGVLAGLVLELLWRHDSITSIYTMPFSWAPAIVIGALARLGEPRLRQMLPASGGRRTGLSGAAVAVLVGLCFLPEVKGQPIMYLLGGPLIAACAVVLIFHLSTWITIPAGWLRPLLMLGTISYATYLWDYPISKWLAGVDQVLSGPAAVATIVLSIAAAAVSWRLVEQPATALRRKWDRREQPASAQAGVRAST